jgi:tetratricopeptide (TPR) repeat protein
MLPNLTRTTCALLCLVAAAPVQGRPDSRAEAARLYRLGEEQFRTGQVEAAIGSFEAGHALSGLPEFLLNLGQCHRALGRYALAISHLERFVAEAPTHALRAATEKTILELQRAQAAQVPPQALPRAEPPSAPVVTEAPRPKTWLWLAGAVLVLGGGAAAGLALANSGRPPILGTVVVPAP